MRQCVHMIRFIDNYIIIVMSDVDQKSWCLDSLIVSWVACWDNSLKLSSHNQLTHSYIFVYNLIACLISFRFFIQGFWRCYSFDFYLNYLDSCRNFCTEFVKCANSWYTYYEIIILCCITQFLLYDIAFFFIDQSINLLWQQQALKSSICYCISAWFVDCDSY